MVDKLIQQQTQHLQYKYKHRYDIELSNSWMYDENVQELKYRYVIWKKYTKSY